MIVLGIETSCDETAAAVVRDGRDVLSSVIYSQVALHRPYGGVVPEIACRCHVEVLPDVIEDARRQAGVEWGGIDTVAVTYGPGLASSLLVGISAAKGLALRLERPLCGVNHLQAHIYSAFMGKDAPAMEAVAPLAALVVSGGHTCIVRVDGPGRYRILGQTLDDAAGEAFDKGANLLGLGYPGGPVIDKTARGGRRDAVRFPRGQVRSTAMMPPGMDRRLCFSYSGLKTALLTHVTQHPEAKQPPQLADVVASYQEAIVDALITGCRRAIESGAGALAAGGGVTLNSRLRERLTELACATRVPLLLAEPRFCGDNAAMIAGLAGLKQGVWGERAMQLDAAPSLPADEG